jgi:hypothetical protein
MKGADAMPNTPGILPADKSLNLEAFSALSTKEQDVLLNLTAGAGTQKAAYVAAYGTKNRATAVVEAAAFFRRPDVQLALAEVQALRRAEYAYLRDQIVSSLIEDTSFDPADAHDEHGNLLPVSEMPRHIRQRITAIKSTRYGINVEFVDRLKAKQMLIDLMGIGGSHSQGLTINIDLGEQPTKSNISTYSSDVSSDGMTLDLRPIDDNPDT